MSEAKRRQWEDPESGYNRRFQRGQESHIVMGYRMLLGWHGHPLAHAKGTIYEHRKVLYDNIGPGPHECHWQCGKTLDWDDIDADHVDGERLNNEPENLVASCRPCNRRRALAGNPPNWRA